MSEKESIIQLLEDISAYELYRKGLYTVKIAKLETGTYVANSLEQKEAEEIFTKTFGRPYASPNEVEFLSQADKEFIKKGGASQVNEKERYTLCGTQGEMWNIPEKKLCQYENLNHSPIIPGSLTSVFQTIQTVVNPRHPSYIRAIRVPSQISLEITTDGGSVLKVNDPAVKHDKGDFICMGADENGTAQPEWGKWVVNGVVMNATYTRELYR